MPIIKTCVICGTEFEVPPSRNFRRCCSRECQAEDKRRRTGTLEERVWRKVEMAGPDDCWEWKASKIKGYARIGWQGKTLKAHRLIFQWSTGVDPAGNHVRHTCDNPGCVNPKHLLLGTPQDNMDDKVKRGRSLRGSQHPTSKLNEKDVRKIRSLKGKMTQQEIADEFGISQAHVSSIQQRKAWSHV